MITKTIDVRIREVLEEHYGMFQTQLEVEYEDKLVNCLMEESYETKHEWATYNQVVIELKNNLHEYQLVQELQYRLTDLECPKNACIEVIGKGKVVTPELQRLYEKIINFKDLM